MNLLLYLKYLFFHRTNDKLLSLSGVENKRKNEISKTKKKHLWPTITIVQVGVIIC